MALVTNTSQQKVTSAQLVTQGMASANSNFSVKPSASTVCQHPEGGMLALNSPELAFRSNVRG